MSVCGSFPHSMMSFVVPFLSSRTLRCGIPHAPSALFRTSLYFLAAPQPSTAQIAGAGMGRSPFSETGGISTMVGTENVIAILLSVADSAFIAGTREVESQRYMTGLITSSFATGTPSAASSPSPSSPTSCGAVSALLRRFLGRDCLFRSLLIVSAFITRRQHKVSWLFILQLAHLFVFELFLCYILPFAGSLFSAQC